MLTCLGIGGLRAGEVVRLRLEDVDSLPYRAVLRVTGKGNKRRVVAIGGPGASVLRAWAKVRGSASSDEPFFVARRPVDGELPREMNVAGIDYVVRKTARAAGLSGVHAHSLRHTAASLALSGGSSLVDVREMLGHSSIVTTSRYLHVTTC